jgi:hypothetical protein
MTSLISCEGVACESSDSCSDHMAFATSKSFLERIDCGYPDLLVPVPLPVHGLRLVEIMASTDSLVWHRSNTASQDARPLLRLASADHSGGKDAQSEEGYQHPASPYPDTRSVLLGWCSQIHHRFTRSGIIPSPNNP